MGHIDAALERIEISVLNTDLLPYISPGHTIGIEKFTKFLKPVFQLILVIFLFIGPIPGLAQRTDTPELTKEEQAWLDKKHVVRVRVGNRPPLVIHNPQPRGIAVDYLKIIAQQFDINFEYVADNEPWIEGFEDIAGDHLRFDLYLAATRTPERMQSYAMSEEYLHSPWVVFSRLETSNILSLEDLRGKKVAVEAGFPQHDMLKKDFPEIELVLVNLTEDALRAVSSGKADASMGNLMVCSYYIQRDGLSNIKVSTTTRYGDHSMAMATRKEWKPLISIINKGLASITEEQKTAIRNTYIPVQFEHGITARDVAKWALISILFVLGIVLFFTFYTRALKTKVNRRTLELKTSLEALQLESQARNKVMGELAESEEKFRDVFNSISDVFTRSDLNGKCVLVSPSVYNLIGYKPEEVLGKNLEDFYADPKQRNKVVEMLQKSKSVINLEIDLVRKDGKTITASTNTKLYYNNEGEPLGVEGNIREITKQKLAENKVLASEARYRDLVDNSLVGVFKTTIDGRFIFVNKAMADMFDFDNVEQMLADRSLARWSDLKQRELMVSLLQRNGEVVNFETQAVTHSGRDIHVIFSAKKKDEQIMGMVMDVTDQKMAEMKVHQYQQRLKDLANELTISQEKIRKQIAVDLHDNVGQLLASMRMQMTGIIEMEENPELTIRLKNISQGLLKSIQATRAAIFDLSPPQLNEIGLVAATHDWMKEQIEQKHHIKTDISSDTEDFKLNENTAFLLFRSIKELIINAVKHGQARQLKVAIRKKDNFLEIAVEDDGVGFDYNVDLLRLKSDSYGLFSIQERTSDLGGSMVVDSVIDKGTKIKLTVPLNEKSL